MGPARTALVVVSLLGGCAGGMDLQASLLSEGDVHALPGAASLEVAYQHVPAFGARLHAMQWSLDGEPILERRWDEPTPGAPAFEVPVFAGIVPPGEHQLSVALEYRVYGCCYACGFIHAVTIRSTRTVAVAAGAEVELCMASGVGGVTAPLESQLAAAVVECPSALR